MPQFWQAVVNADCAAGYSLGLFWRTNSIKSCAAVGGHLRFSDNSAAWLNSLSVMPEFLIASVHSSAVLKSSVWRSFSLLPYIRNQSSNKSITRLIDRSEFACVWLCVSVLSCCFCSELVKVVKLAVS